MRVPRRGCRRAAGRCLVRRLWFIGVLLEGLILRRVSVVGVRVLLSGVGVMPRGVHIMLGGISVWLNTPCFVHTVPVCRSRCLMRWRLVRARSSHLLLQRLHIVFSPAPCIVILVNRRRHLRLRRRRRAHYRWTTRRRRRLSGRRHARWLCCLRRLCELRFSFRGRTRAGPAGLCSGLAGCCVLTNRCASTNSACRATRWATRCPGWSRPCRRLRLGWKCQRLSRLLRLSHSCSRL